MTLKGKSLATHFHKSVFGATEKKMFFYILLASGKLASPLFLEQKETELAEAIRQGARLYQKFSRNVSSIVTTENNVCWSLEKIEI